MNLVQTVAPTTDPVTLAEVKAHLHLEADYTAEDTLLGRLVKVATAVVQRKLRRQLITATWRLGLDRFPRGTERTIRIPRPPLQSVASVAYADAAGATQTWDSANYEVQTDGAPGLVALANGASWPATRTPVEGRSIITITYAAGYGATSAAVPEDFRIAILYLVAHYHAFREPLLTGTIVNAIPLTVESLLADGRVYEFA